MADPTLLTKARKARFDDLPNFSGHPSEDVERFLKSIKNITKVNDESENHELSETVRGKLTQSAGIWLDNNESNFTKWSDFETAFRNQYFSTTMIHKKFDKLKQRKQEQDETITAYFDDVVSLCREIDPKMTDMVIIQHLMSGLKPDFRKELSRRESSMNKLSEFLKYAKIEQDLHDKFEKSQHLSLDPQSSYYNDNYPTIPPLTATINRTNQYYHNDKHDNQSSRSTPLQSSVAQRNSIPEHGNRTSAMVHKKQTQNYPSKLTFNYKPNNNQFTSQHQFSKCTVCGRQSHRTIDCFYKRTTGCYTG